MNPVPPDSVLLAASPDQDLASTAPDWEIWRPQFRFPRWLQDNPGLVFTALYLALSAVGLLYQFLFFRRFQLNVLEFSDATDFLMVVVREPLPVAMASLGLFFYWGYMWLTLRAAEKFYRRWPKWRNDAAKLAASREKARKMVPSAQAMFIVTYAVLFTMLYSVWQSQQARTGAYPKVTVQYKGDSWATAPFEATLLGTTSRFIILYRPETKRAEALPFDAIANLSWDARRRKDRDADADRGPAAQLPPPAAAPAGK